MYYRQHPRTVVIIFWSSKLGGWTRPGDLFPVRWFWGLPVMPPVRQLPEPEPRCLPEQAPEPVGYHSD